MLQQLSEVTFYDDSKVATAPLCPTSNTNVNEELAQHPSYTTVTNSELCLISYKLNMFSTSPVATMQSTVPLGNSWSSKIWTNIANDTVLSMLAANKKAHFHHSTKA